MGYSSKPLAPIPQKVKKTQGEKEPNLKKKKKRVEPEEYANPATPLSTNSALQNVEQFKHFLLSNDSSFVEYINSDLLKSTFDTHLMKEGMITFMA